MADDDMVHINFGKEHKWLKMSEIKEQYPDIYKALTTKHDPSALVRKLKFNRKRHCLGLREMAKVMEITPSRLSALERGQEEMTDALASHYAFAIQHLVFTKKR